MIIRDKSLVQPVEWGNGLSYRLLVEADNMGFAFAHTVVSAGSTSRLRYDNHLEACYCISGSGKVITASGEISEDIAPGVLYALDKHDAHFLIADAAADMHLISVFTPPIRGDEKHNLDESGFSHY